MNKFLASALGLMAVIFSLNAAELPSDKFAKIPANPEFSFSRSLKAHSRESGEKSPIANPYYIGKYPVTNAEYAEFAKATGHKVPRYWINGRFPKGKEKHPVLEVSYEDAKAYCKYLSSKYPSWNFRLPTEAEWENAAKGPKNYEFPWGNSSEVKMVNGAILSNFNFNAVIASVCLKKNPEQKVTFNHPKSTQHGKQVALKDLISVDSSGRIRGWINHREHTGFVYTDLYKQYSANGGYTTAVDQFPKGKSPYGCFDMAGNSWDWTSSNITATNGAERGKMVKAIRGGSWYAVLNSCRTNYRGEGRRERGAYSTVGFRIAVNADGTAEPEVALVDDSKNEETVEKRTPQHDRKPPQHNKKPLQKRR